MLKKQKSIRKLKKNLPCLAFAAGCAAGAAAGIAAALYYRACSGKKSAKADKEKIRTNLLRALSHDLRTPLSGIMGNCLVFLENHELLSEEEKIEIVTNIYKESDWLINMAENLLLITRIKDTGLTVNTNEEVVEEVIGEVLQKMKKRYPDHEIHAIIPEYFIMLPMDATLIEQAAVNLLENAILHSDSAKPLEIIVKDEPETVSFTIRDYGCGIPEEMLSTLFDGNVTYSADTHKGMGIGLSICKAIVDAHHGTITGRNHGHGAEFVFTLPKENREQVS